jgi:hypothetical protein
VIRNVALLLLLALGALPGGALAAESPRRGSFQLRIVPFRPNIDAEFDGAASPYRDIFGGGRKVMVGVDVAWSVRKLGWGTLDLGGAVGYVQARGKALLPASEGGGESGDNTTLRIIPTSLTLTYRLDELARLTRWLPLAPYGRATLDRYNWWVAGASGGATDANGRHSTGATNGYSFAGGIAILLDAIDPRRAVDMDNDTGINDVYLYGEAIRSHVDDFGSSSSWSLSPDRPWMYGFGLLFVF